MATNNKKIAENVLEAVGGKNNVTSAAHCMTRLRLILKDESIPNDEAVKKISGVLGVARSGGQYQIIIGTNVDKVCDEFCALTGMNKGTDVDEDLGDVKKKVTLKRIGLGIMDVLSGSLNPVIPVMLAASIFKALVAVLGPDMLGILSAESHLFTLFTFVGDAGFYFFPVLLGYTCAKKVGASPVMGIFLGGIMLHPTFMAMVDSGQTFSVYGIPCSVQNYASTLIPIVMSVWVMSKVEAFLKKHVPDNVKILVVPTLTTAIMLPIALCVLGPLGSFLGKYICNAILAFGNVAGFLGVALIAASWEFLVMTGMHHIMIAQMVMVFMSQGSEAIVSVGACLAGYGVMGMCLGMFFVLKDKEQKGLSMSYFVATLVGGVTEPGLYGVGMRWTKPFVGMAIGGFVGGLYAGLIGVTSYALVPVANFLGLTAFAGGSASNFINGIIAAVITTVVSAIATYFLCRNIKQD